MKTKTTLLFLTLILCACLQDIVITQTLPTITPSPFYTATPTTTPTVVHLDQSIIDFPVATPIFDKQCGGVVPGELFSLSYVVDDAVKMLDPNAEGWAEGIMQDCFEDTAYTHSIVFGMWFYIDKPTPDIKDYEVLGSWIIDVMNILDTIPRNEHTTNAEPSVVYFRFYEDASSLLDVRVQINKYQAEAIEKTGADVFLLFHTNP